MAPVLWDYQAKLDIWDEDSSDMRVTTLELITPDFFQSLQGEKGISRAWFILF